MGWAGPDLHPTEASMAGETPHGDKTHAQLQRTIAHREGPNVPAGGGARIRTEADPRRPPSTHRG